MIAEYLDIDTTNFPVRKRYTFGGTTYVVVVKHNVSNQFFTMEIYDSIGKTFLYSNRITYGLNVTESILSPVTQKIIPLNVQVLAGNSKNSDITTSTFGNAIKLYTRIEEE